MLFKIKEIPTYSYKPYESRILCVSILLICVLVLNKDSLFAQILRNHSRFAALHSLQSVSFLLI